MNIILIYYFAFTLQVLLLHDQVQRWLKNQFCILLYYNIYRTARVFILLQNIMRYRQVPINFAKHGISIRSSSTTRCMFLLYTVIYFIGIRIEIYITIFLQVNRRTFRGGNNYTYIILIYYNIPQYAPQQVLRGCIIMWRKGGV